MKLKGNGRNLLNPRNRLRETLEKLLWAFRLEVLVKNAIDYNLAEVMADPDYMQTWEAQLKPAHIQAFRELILQAGSHTLPEFAGGQTIHWNNKEK